MNSAYLILGGNIGNKLKNLENTRLRIQENIGNITGISEIFITAPWGNTEQPDFYNQALIVETALSPESLLDELLKIEAENGRVRDDKKWSERTIDIDILFYNDEIISLPKLKVPHPHIQVRRFVLAPLAQIAGEFIHPVFKESIASLLRDCPDNSAISILKKTAG
ncbi:MAG TPA: 2-amino-4-hydroxy-6-hydroxymethyldihydropteridine diphosphokinase [Bacteroidia bacterium]|jgi:2-amino-4-hydroxy-6-hydroxymethyldihydropteridine diphosphokinase